MIETIKITTNRAAVYPWWKKYPGLIALAGTIHFLPWWYGWFVGYALGSAISGFWWLGNDEDENQSFIFRYIRNNSMNFKRFVIGVADRDHWVSGTAPAGTVLRADLGERGWQCTVIWIGPIPCLPFISYSGASVQWYLGWQPWGEFAVKVTISGGPQAF